MSRPSDNNIIQSLYSILSFYKKNSSLNEIENTFYSLSFLSLESRIEYILMQNNLKCYWAELLINDFKYMDFPFFIKINNKSVNVLDLCIGMDDKFMYFKKKSLSISQAQKNYCLIVKNRSINSIENRSSSNRFLKKDIFLYFVGFLIVFSGFVTKIGIGDSGGHLLFEVLHGLFFFISSLFVFVIYSVSGNDRIISFFCNSKKESCQSVLNVNPFRNYTSFTPKLFVLSFMILHILVFLCFSSTPFLHYVVLLISFLVIAYLVYFQFKIKSFCKICLGLSLSIVLFTICYLNVNKKYQLTLNSSFEYLIITIVSIFVAYVIDKWHKLGVEKKELNQKMLSFLLDTRLFKAYLSQKTDIILGSSQLYKQHICGADKIDVEIDIIVSLHCPHCCEVISVYTQLVQFYECVSLNIWIDPKGGFSKGEQMVIQKTNQAIVENNLFNYINIYKQWYLSRANDSVQNNIMQEVQQFRTPSVFINKAFIPPFYTIDALKYNLSIYTS